MKVYPYFDGYLVRRNENGPFLSFFVDGKPSWTKREFCAQGYASEQEAEESIERIKSSREARRGMTEEREMPVSYYHQDGTLKWSSLVDVGHLILQLQTLDSRMKVSAVMHIDTQHGRKARAHGLSMSRERWDGAGWLDFSLNTPECLAIWAYDEKDAPEIDRLRAALDARDAEVKKLEKNVGELFNELEGVNPGRVTTRDNRILEMEAAYLRMCKEVAVRDLALLAAQEAPHSAVCDSLRMIQPPQPEWTEPVCRTMGNCGACQRCKWRLTPEGHPVRGKCNCWKARFDSALAALAAAKVTNGR